MVTGHLDGGFPTARWVSLHHPGRYYGRDGQGRSLVLPVGEAVAAYGVLSTRSSRWRVRLRRAADRLARLANITRGVSEEALMAAGVKLWSQRRWTRR